MSSLFTKLNYTFWVIIVGLPIITPINIQVIKVKRLNIIAIFKLIGKFRTSCILFIIKF